MNEFSPQDIRNMGGWYKESPKLFIATSLAAASLIGLPLMSGFISKEMIVVPMFRRAIESGSIIAWAYVAIFFISSMLTVLYTYRMYVTVFFGQKATPHADLTPIPPVMQWPVSLLAVLSLWIFFAWNIAGPGTWMSHFRSEPSLTISHWNVNFPLSSTIAWISFAWTLASLCLGWLLFTKRKFRPREEQYSLDHAYEFVVVTPSLKASDALARFDKKGIDRMVHLFVYVQVGIAKVAGYFDRYVVDGAVTATTWVTRAAGNIVRYSAGGRIQTYLVWSAAALIIFIFWLIK